MDGANWLAHYADHRLDPLWRFHALHHSQEELSVITSFRAHPLMHTTGFLLASGLGAHSSYLHVLGCLLLFAIGNGISFVPLTSAALVGVPQQAAGAASGLVNVTQPLGEMSLCTTRAIWSWIAPAALALIAVLPSPDAAK